MERQGKLWGDREGREPLTPESFEVPHQLGIKNYSTIIDNGCEGCGQRDIFLYSDIFKEDCENRSELSLRLSACGLSPFLSHKPAIF